MVFWITGLPGAGKTTLAKILTRDRSIFPLKPIHLDGDEIRKILNSETSKWHDRESRISLSYKYSKLANLLSNQGHNVIVSTVSLFSEIHDWNRNNMAKYFEIFIKVSIKELLKRDQKNLYSDFQKGDVKNVPGMDFKIDIPKKADCIIDFEKTPETKLMIKSIKREYFRKFGH